MEIERKNSSPSDSESDELDLLSDEDLDLIDAYEQALRDSPLLSPDRWLVIQAKSLVREQMQRLHWLYKTRHGRAALGVIGLPEDVPGYEFIREVGRGGMGVVYEARQKSLNNRTVAVKMVLAGQFASTKDFKRLQSEALAAARLNHPNIVPVYDFGEHDGRPFIAMKYVAGESLDTLLRRTLFDPQQSARYALTIARAIDYSHRQDVLHRDLKPANILLAAKSTAGDDESTLVGSPREYDPVIVDFGLARCLNDERKLTLTGETFGTPEYTAPERLNGQEATAESDIYSIGAILFEMLTGRPPFTGTPTEIMDQARRKEAQFPRAPDQVANQNLETICLKCLAKESARRYQSAKDLALELERFLDGRPILARRSGLVERWRLWARREPILARLVNGIAGLLLLLLIAVGLITAAYLREITLRRNVEIQESEARAARHEADRESLNARHHATEADRARIRAEDASRLLQRTLVMTQVDYGILAGDRGQPGEAALRFADAALRSTDDANGIWANGVRADLWARSLPAPLRCVRHPGGPVCQIEFHPSGDYLLSRDEKGGLRIWDLGAESSLPIVPDNSIVSCATFSPDGKWLAIGGPEHDLEILSFPDGRLLHRVPNSHPATAVTFSSNGNLLAVAAGSIRVWNCVAAEFVGPPYEQPQPVVRLAFNSTATQLVTGSLDNLARVFAIGPNAKPERLFLPVPNLARSWEGIWWSQSEPVFIDNDRDFLTLESEEKIAWRRVTSGRVLETIDLKRGGSNTAVSPDGHWIAISCFGGTQLWDVRTRRKTGPLLAHSNFVENASFSPDNRLLLTVSRDRTARLWSVPDGAAVSPPLYVDQLQRGFFSPVGYCFATVQAGGLIRIWTLPDLDSGDAFHAVESGTSFFAISKDHRLVLPKGTHHGDDGLLETQVYDTSRNQAVGKLLTPTSTITGGGFICESQQTAILCKSPNVVELWDWKTGKRLWGPNAMPSMPLGVVQAGDGKTGSVFITCERGEILALDPSDGKIRCQADHGGDAALFYYSGPSTWVLASPDGSRIVTWGLGDSVCVWDTTDLSLQNRLQHDGRCYDAHLSSDGQFLVTSSLDRTAKVWDLKTGSLVAGPFVHPDWVFNSRFSPDGRRVLTICRDHMARIWDQQSGRMVGSVMAHDDEVFDGEFSLDGKFVVTVGQDATARLWETETGKALAPPQFLPGQAYQVTLSAEGTQAIIGGATHGIFLLGLGRLTGPSEMRLGEDDRKAWSELISGKTLQESGTTNSEANDWLDRWRRFREGKLDFLAWDGLSKRCAAWHRHRAVMAELQSQQTTVIWHLSKLLETDGKDAWESLRLGRAYAALDQMDDTIRACSDAIGNDASLCEAWLLRGETYGRQHRWELAVEDFSQAALIEPLRLSAHIHLGDASFQLGRWQNAVDQYTRALELKPDLPLIRIRQAQASAHLLEQHK